MAIWKEQPQPKPAAPPPPTNPIRPEVPPMTDASHRPAARDSQESVLAADIAIEGSISGQGHVRLAGRFKGDINVQGNVTIEAGAKVTGSVRAATVTVAGELEGNIEGATRVELQQSGVIAGDVKAGSLTVAAGSKMRGNVEFGWDDKVARAAASGAA